MDAIGFGKFEQPPSLSRSCDAPDQAHQQAHAAAASRLRKIQDGSDLWARAFILAPVCQAGPVPSASLWGRRFGGGRLNGWVPAMFDRLSYTYQCHYNPGFLCSQPPIGGLTMQMNSLTT
jgi:hypothetical protein